MVEEYEVNDALKEVITKKFGGGTGEEGGEASGSADN